MADPPAGAEVEASTTEQDQDVQIDPRDVASAGRSCSVILILLAAIILALCVGTALRWVILG
jgi:hypothetical protein